MPLESAAQRPRNIARQSMWFFPQSAPSIQGADFGSEAVGQYHRVHSCHPWGIIQFSKRKKHNSDKGTGADGVEMQKKTEGRNNGASKLGLPCHRAEGPKQIKHPQGSPLGSWALGLLLFCLNPHPHPQRQAKERISLC